MSFKKNFFKNVLVTGGYNYVAQLITFLSSFITARLLLPENYGLVGLATIFTNFISVFADSGVSLAVIKSDYGRSFHKAMDGLSLVIGTTLFLLTCLLAWPIASFYNNPALILPTIVLGFTFITRSTSIVRAALMSKALKFNEIGRVTLANAVISVVLTIILAYFHAEHWSIVIPLVVTSILPTLYFERKLRLGFNLYSFKYLRAAFDHTKGTISKLLGFNLVNYWSRNSDNLIVGKLYGTNDLGIYNRAYSLLTMPLSLVTGLMGTVLYPSLKKLQAEGGDVQGEYTFVLKIISIITYPIALVLVLFPFQLVSILWGENWIDVALLLPYFGLLLLSQSLLSTCGNILVLLGKERELMISGWVGAFLIIGGIVAGAFFSLVAIAQFYSLAFILFVLPFNMLYVFKGALAFNTSTVLRFWLPVIILSLGIWVACFFDILALKLIFLLLMFVNIILGSRREIAAIIDLARARLGKPRQ